MIVRASGASTGLFYFYFRNKEDLFAAALEDLAVRMSAALNAAIARAGADPAAHMRAAVHALVAFLAEHPKEARILILESSGLSGRLERIRRRVMASHAKGVEQAMVALRHAGRLPACDPRTAARCWVGAVYEAVHAWLETPPGKRSAAVQLAAAIAQFCLRGIGFMRRG
jgi:AcrR family transcriptional regulator